MLPDVFENFQNICLKIYEIDLARSLIAPGLSWEAALKKNKIKLNILTYINILLNVEKGIRGGICHAARRYIKLYKKGNIKYMKGYE